MDSIVNEVWGTASGDGVFEELDPSEDSEWGVLEDRRWGMRSRERGLKSSGLEGSEGKRQKLGNEGGRVGNRESGVVGGSGSTGFLRLIFDGAGCRSSSS